MILALERAIARLMTNNKLKDHLIFKGGFVLLKQIQSSRFTSDADALAIDISKENLTQLIEQSLIKDLEDVLCYGDIQTEDLIFQGKYGALRFSCAFQIGEPKHNKLYKFSRIHIDPITESMLSIINTNPISWRIYPKEYILAEKLETLLTRGSTNSRSKDIYDLVLLFQLCKNKKKLISSVKKTFENRGVDLPNSFFEQVSFFETIVLKAAWKAVKVKKSKLSFEENWQLLLAAS